MSPTPFDKIDFGNPFAESSFPIPESSDSQPTSLAIDPKQVAQFTSFIAVSAVWTAAILGTQATLREGIPAGIKSAFNPTALKQGFTPSFFYSGAIEAALKAQDEARKHGGNIAGIAAGTVTETALGSLFDVSTLRHGLFTAKWNRCLKEKPDLVKKFSAEELSQLMPQYKDSSPTTLAQRLEKEGPSAIKMTSSNMSLLRRKGLGLMPRDIALATAAALPFALARNTATYVVAEAQSGKGMNPLLAAGLGAAATFHANASVYDAATHTAEGHGITGSMRKAFTHASKTTTDYPSRLAAAWALRTGAIYATAICLGEEGQATIAQYVDQAVKMAASYLGLSDLEKTPPQASPQQPKSDQVVMRSDKTGERK